MISPCKTHRASNPTNAHLHLHSISLSLSLSLDPSGCGWNGTNVGHHRLAGLTFG